jgi:hypothetical protein
MPSTFEIDRVRHIVIVRMTGEITDVHLVELYDRLRSEEILASNAALLIDLREAKGVDVTSAGVRALSRLPLVFPPEARRAVVVPTSLGFGMVRMYGLWRGEEGGIRAFRDFDEAMDWVGTP